MNIQTYQDYFNSYKSFYLDKSFNGLTVEEVKIIYNIPCPRNKVAIRLHFEGNNILNLFVKDVGCLSSNLETYQKMFLGQKQVYCFTEHQRKFRWNPFACNWVYVVRFVFSNGKWVGYQNPYNSDENSCEALYVESL